MNRPIIAALIASLAIARGWAANPFLDAKDDRPVSAVFHGAEWGDNIAQDEIALSARVVTTRIAKATWGAIFKIEFTELKSHAKKPREISPEYFVVTDDRIGLLNEENNQEATTRIVSQTSSPELEPDQVYGINGGQFEHEEGPWTTKITIKGDECVYLSTHSSGHFKKVVWRKGVGLVEYSMGYGAMADGFRLKRAVSTH